MIISVVASNLEEIEEEEFDEDDKEGRKPIVIILNMLDNCMHFFALLLYEQEICKTYLESFKNVSYLVKKIFIVVMLSQ